MNNYHGRIFFHLKYLGKLDCLRVALSPEEKTESQIQRAKRLSGQWESDCAFEA